MIRAAQLLLEEQRGRVFEVPKEKKGSLYDLAFRC